MPTRFADSKSGNVSRRIRVKSRSQDTSRSAKQNPERTPRRGSSRLLVSRPHGARAEAADVGGVFPSSEGPPLLLLLAWAEPEQESPARAV